jgi:hypothetical protein
VLRAFLSFNGAFEIVLFNTFLEHFHAQRFAERMPLCCAMSAAASGCGAVDPDGAVKAHSADARRARSCCSNIAFTLFASAANVNGFVMSSTPGSRRPWWTIALRA